MDEIEKLLSERGTVKLPRLELSRYTIAEIPSSKEVEAKKLAEEKLARQIDLRNATELKYNPEYADLREVELEQQEELRSQGKLIKKNTLTGHVEMTYLSEAQFEEQRRQHESEAAASSIDVDNARKEDQETIDEPSSSSLQVEKISYKKKKRVKNDDPFDIDNYAGPWATFKDERHVSKPSDEDAAIISEYMAKRKKRAKPINNDDEANNEPTAQEKAQLHIKDPYDYQGRSFLEAPRDLDNVNLYSDSSPDGCRIPRTLAHTFRGHNKAITAIRYFPRTAHLLLSSSLDNKIKLWQMYKEKRCIMTFSGHQQGVRDICFNRDGDKFVSASYDKYLKLWSTETGQCLQRFTNNKMAYCVKFHPDKENSHLFLAGMSNKKVLCWDCRSGDIVQEYDRHLGAVNTLTFVDENRKFISTSDDKSFRVWEWDIPVDIKYIADPSLHSMPAVTSAPDNKKLLCQSMDNKIHAFICHNKFKLDNKKVFKGHMVAGYACVPDFSCDMSIVISGDADGKIFFWSWNTTRIITSIKAHDSACISVLWHPHERQKLVSAGWDNLIKIWE